LRIFKLKAFARWARKEGIKDAVLAAAVSEMEKGLVDAKLGGGVFKKRIAASSRGKRGGARTLVAFQSGKHTFFMFGFLKKDTDNIDQVELKSLRAYAERLFALRADELNKLILDEEIFEVL
jgi:hypothetical protein